MTTSSTAIFVPFTTQELFQSGGEALYYGLNALSNNLIMVDRKQLKNPNGLILGTPGSGKSFSAKREILNVFLVTDDDILIADPEAEYYPLVQRLDGQVIKISPTSKQYVNPMDLNLDYSDDESPLSLKVDFLLSFCDIVVGSKDGLQPVEKTVIDRCVRLVYQKYLTDPRPENMPILEDLYDALRAQEEKEAQFIATALEIYVTGSLNVFNHRTNVDIDNRIVCYDIKELGKQLKQLGIVSIFLNWMSSCSMLAEGVMSGLGGSTHPSSDEAMLGAEAAYAGMENELQSYLDSYESTHDYDEYSYDLDEIGHDPYVLMALLNAYHWGGWTLEQVQGTLEMLFERQYTLTETVTVETRYNDDDEPYEYSICTVTLDNFDLSHLPVYLLDEEGMNIYAVYIATLGNRPDLFPASEYPNVSQRQDYLDYDVPPEALEDEVFAAMLAEAEKYLGYPYVWGGSSPSTSFDCSGFVSWVINHSGWNVGRLGAQGLCNICTPVSPANARPGDLVFFKYTYNAPNPDGVTHCGIYVGKVIPPIPDRARSR